ncbi:MAG: hypothetical protein RL226_236, partial [Bacteroidota bacterium]
MRYTNMAFRFLLLFAFFPLALLAQPGRQNRPLYQIGSKYNGKAWHFAPGATFTIPNMHPDAEMLVVNSETGKDTLFNGTFDASGKIGLYLEGGWAKFFENPILFHYLDYGFHYKWLRGEENFNGLTQVNSAFIPVVNNGRFSQHYLGGFFHVNHITQLTDWT